jgi:uncharacterized SAM-binding protein YcdF (DUF218 family)
MADGLSSRIIAELLLPPGLFVVLLAAAGLLGRRWPRLGGTLVALVGTALYLLSTAFVSTSLLAAVEGPPTVLDPAPLRGAADTAIVVLSADLRYSAAEYGGDTAGRLTLERLRYAARLRRATDLPILVTGGSLNERKSVATTMKEALEHDFAVPVRWVEDRSRDTWENAFYSAEMLRRDGITRVVLVTHAFHMPRSLAVFRATGLEVIPAPTLYTEPRTLLPVANVVPTMNSLQRSYFALHEMIGLVWYRILPRPVARR